MKCQGVDDGVIEKLTDDLMRFTIADRAIRAFILTDVHRVWIDRNWPDASPSDRTSEVIAFAIEIHRSLGIAIGTA